MKEPKVDERTREYLQKWGRLEVPTAQITGGSVNPGTYRAMACLGWIERRGPEGASVPVVGVHFMLLQNQAYVPMATLSLAMPVTKNTELLINTFLHFIGWDGRVWPYDGDDDWPANSEEDEAQVRALLQKLHPKIGSTLTFPTIPGVGTPILQLPVLKRSATYPLAPFEPVPEDRTPPVTHLERFRALCRDPSPFGVPN